MVYIHFTIDPADVEAVRAELSPHYPGIHFCDLDGVAFCTVEATGPEARHHVYRTQRVKAVFPGPSGTLGQMHVDELDRSRRLAGKTKKGAPMRDALSAIYAETGNDAHSPEWN